MQDPKFSERFVSFGADPVSTSPEQFAAMIAEEIPLWADAVNVAGIGIK